MAGQAKGTLARKPELLGDRSRRGCIDQELGFSQGLSYKVSTYTAVAVAWKSGIASSGTRSACPSSERTSV